jgi:hypothetical protein
VPRQRAGTHNHPAKKEEEPMNGRTRIVISRRHLLLIVFNAMLGGLVIGYVAAFFMWWNQ